MSKNPRLFRVMRFRVLQGVFTLPELRVWMLANLPEEYHSEIRVARYGWRREFGRMDSLAWIAVLSEYCSIKVSDREGNIRME